MKSKLRLTTISRLKLLLIILLLLGILFRFTNLDKKVYWHDEVYTSSWVSGYLPQEVQQGLFTGQLLTVDDVQKYQHLNPDRTVIDTVTLLAKHDTQHPPLYYIIVRSWAGAFGDSIASIRGVTALLSLLSLPFAYWLGLGLFRSRASAWMLTALVAISPFQILYAQEAREYSLWIAMIFFASAALLRAMRKSSHLNWGIYALSLTLGLYTYLFTVLIMCAHGIYVFVMQRLRLTQLLFNYVLATLISCLLFTPWLIQLLVSPAPIGASGWTSRPMSIPLLVRSWVVNAGRVFFDINSTSSDPLIFTALPLFLLSIFIGYSLFFLCRKAPVRIWLFILLFGGFTALVLIVPDIVAEGRRSSVNRYLIPVWLSIQLSVAYWFGLVITAHDSLWKQFQKIVILLIFSASLISDVAIVQSDTWWTKKNSHHHPKTAEIINQSERPLLLSSNFNLNKGELLSLSHMLDSDVRLLLVRGTDLPQIPQGFDDVFLFNPSIEMRKKLEAAGYLIEPVYKEDRLWQIVQF